MTMKITAEYFATFYAEHKDMMDFVHVSINRLARDSWSEENVRFEDAFDAIFDGYDEEDGSYAVPADEDAGTGPFEFKGEYIEALKDYCQECLEETVGEFREDYSAPHPSLSACQRNR